jgi:hypothetical protein
MIDPTIQYLAALLAFVGLLLALMIGAACGLILTRDSEKDEGENVKAIRDVLGCRIGDKNYVLQPKKIKQNLPREIQKKKPNKIRKLGLGKNIDYFILITDKLVNEIENWIWLIMQNKFRASMLHKFNLSNTLSIIPYLLHPIYNTLPITPYL